MNESPYTSAAAPSVERQQWLAIGHCNNNLVSSMAIMCYIQGQAVMCVLSAAGSWSIYIYI